jgi:hypothetical protein
MAEVFRIKPLLIGQLAFDSLRIADVALNALPVEM